MMKMVPFKIISVENGNTPNEEKVRLKAFAPVNTQGYALVDRTFDENGELSNEFRHIYVFPALDLEKGQEVILRSSKGKNELAKFSNSEEWYYRLFWGADKCVWNNNGKDTATLIKYEVVNAVKVPPVKKKE